MAAELNASVTTQNDETLIAQMSELGLSRPLCEAALERTGWDVDRATDFCIEHEGDLDSILQADEVLTAAVASNSSEAHAGALLRRWITTKVTQGSRHRRTPRRAPRW